MNYPRSLTLNLSAILGGPENYPFGGDRSRSVGKVVRNGLERYPGSLTTRP